MFAVFHRNEFVVALQCQGMESGDEIDFVLLSGEQRVNDLHRDLDLDLGALCILVLLIPVFLDHMDEEVVALLCDANVFLFVLD